MLIIKDEIKKALEENKPVVALESTIISHGMPYPKNVETALRVEKVIRDNGAVPAPFRHRAFSLSTGFSPPRLLRGYRNSPPPGYPLYP